MELLYVQTLLDYKHLEPSGQKEGARRHIFDANMPPQFFLPNAEMKASFVFEIRLCHCILQKIRIRFRNQDAEMNATKKPRFKPKRSSFSDKLKCSYKLRNACDNQVDRNDPHDCDAGKERIEQQCDA